MSTITIEREKYNRNRIKAIVLDTVIDVLTNEVNTTDVTMPDVSGDDNEFNSEMAAQYAINSTIVAHGQQMLECIHGALKMFGIETEAEPIAKEEGVQ